MSVSPQLKKLQSTWITAENFRPYGQVIFPSQDGKSFDQDDAQLNLHNGIPRLYIMRLYNQGLKFHHITRHTQCTQCLGALEGKDWFIAVCPPCNDLSAPMLEEIAAFHVPGNCFIKLEVGTWHAGPFFQHEFVDFYNLELSDTNLVDHFTHNFHKTHQLGFEIV
jgi:ureidoglycolate hydrolase